jgi:hypothetical protein
LGDLRDGQHPATPITSTLLKLLDRITLHALGA